jgi:hypothetical protein
VTPGETLGTLYNIHVGSNKTKQHALLFDFRQPWCFNPVPGPRYAGNLSRPGKPRLPSHLVPARAVACRS